MPGLTLTAPQAQIITDTDSELDTALSGGVNNAVPAQIIPPLPTYSSAFTSAQKLEMRQFYESLIAAFITAVNMPAEFPLSTFTGTAVLTKLTGLGSNGSLTFVNGICTAYSAPT